MKKVRNLISNTILFILCIGLMGCISFNPQFKRWNIRYDVKKNLSGNLTEEFCGFDAKEMTPEEKKEEVNEYHSEFTTEHNLKNVKAEIVNETQDTYDIKITGDFDNLISALEFFTSGGDFEIKKKENLLNISLCINEIDNEKQEEKKLEQKGITDPFEGFLYITYEGKIVENNAPVYDEKNHLMEWNLFNVDHTGIHFVLDIVE